MGRISQYKKKVGPAVILSGKTSADDILPGAAEALLEYSAAFDKLNKVQTMRRDKETELDATNQYYDFVKQQSAIREQLKVDEGSATADTEVVRDKIINQSRGLMEQVVGGIQDPLTKKKFLIKAERHLASDTESLNIWAYAKRRENLVNDGRAELHIMTSNAGYDPDSGDLLGAADQFKSQILDRIDEYQKTLKDLVTPKQLEGMIKSYKKQAYATHFAQRLEEDPEILLAQVQAGDYDDPMVSMSQKRGVMTAAQQSVINMQQNQLTSDIFEKNYKMNKLARGLNTGELTRSQVYAEWSLAPEGETKELLEMALTGQLDAVGREVEPVSAEARQFNSAKLLDEMQAVGVTPRPTLEKALKYKEISAKALLSLKSGDITKGQFNNIVDIANISGAKEDKALKSIQQKFLSSKMGEFSRLISSEDDPREYVLYRMLNEVDRDATARKLSKAQKQVMKEQILNNVISAFEIYAPDDEAYSELQKRMQQPEQKEKMYNLFAYALPGEAGQNRGLGYNIFYRSLSSARGEEYTGVVKKDGKEYRIVANSGVAQYIRVPDEVLQKLNRK
jgi:hypothetical protein